MTLRTIEPKPGSSSSYDIEHLVSSALPHPSPKALHRRQPFACQPEKTPSTSPLAPEHMPSIYHLHPTPSQPDFGILTPPASPGRRFASPHPQLTESDMAGTTCSCGHSMFDGKGCCPACLERQQKRHYRLSGRQTAELPATPPPSNPVTPRESLDGGRHAPALLSRTRDPSAAVTLSSALSSNEEHPDIFPASFYRTSSRVRRDYSPSSMPIVPVPRTSTIRHSQDHVGPVVGQLARPSTPVDGNGAMATRDYSPMAAGFARLSRKEARHHTQNDAGRRVGSERGSLDIHARLFDGPA